MQTRKLGFTDLNLTTVGLGTWAIGGPWQFGWGPQDDQQAIAAIIEAAELGINWIDTAPIYGCGHSEELIGQALKQLHTKPFIATKCGLIWNSRREKISNLKRDSILRECDDSLKRMGLDVIDLYQIHWPQPDEDLEQAWEAMAQLVEQGKVRCIGGSNFEIPQLQRVQKIWPLASLQPQYNMLHRQIEDRTLEFCFKNHIGIVAYSPMARGLLTGKFSYKRLEQLPPDDHRLRSPDFQDPMFSATLELVERLRSIARRNSVTLAQLAIAWTLRRPEVTAAIVGARNPAQIKETAPAADLTLSPDDIEEIEFLLQKRLENLPV